MGLWLVSVASPARMVFNHYFWLLFFTLGNQCAKRTMGVKDQGVEVSQPQRFVSARTGATLELECQVTGRAPPGPVVWFLGEGSSRKLVYADKKHKDLERVSRKTPGSDTDFTIFIHNLTLEDAGKYYCVKKNPSQEDWKTGYGTEVVVKESNSHYIIPTVVGITCLFLVGLLTVAFYFYVKKKKGRKCCTRRSENSPPEKVTTADETCMEKEIVYADLKDNWGTKSAKTSIRKEHSEYATVRVESAR